MQTLTTAGPYLNVGIDTRQGHYMAGLPITVLANVGYYLAVCLDNNFHPAGICHTEILSPTQVRD